MPSIQTLVADLNNGSISYVGALPDPRRGTDSTLSDSHHIKYRHFDMVASLANGNRLNLKLSTGNDVANGRYLGYGAKCSAVVKMTTNLRIVASGYFSGCAYQVFKNNGEVICVHISRPIGKNLELFVKMMEDYRQQKGWTKLHDITTSGKIGQNGCTGLIAVSQRIGNRVDSILIHFGHGGAIVATSDFQSTQI